MKRILSILMVLVLALGMLAGCAGDKEPAGGTEMTDAEYVADKGTLVVGITNFKPMDYEENGEWVGFDADMAKKFAESLGVKVEFKEIVWDNKVLELNDKGIDCVWNGMTLNDAVMDAMGTSNAYCKNAQVVVVKADVADKYKTVDDIKELKFAVESGSAGEDVAKENELDYVAAEDQATALNEVKARTSDACIIDLLMAGATIGEGTDYADLAYTVSLNSEEYGVGFRKGSDLVEKFNTFWADELANGNVMTVAQQYGVQESIIK